MAKTFGWRVESEATTEHRFDVRTVQFGGGYQQRQRKFLKGKLRSWSVRRAGSLSELAPLRAFLDGCGGVEAFNWQAPGGETVLVTCTEYTETGQGGKIWQLSAKFEEVMA